MIGSKCPGQDDRKIEVALIKCPSCGYKVEIFSDEIKTRCPSCKTIVYREKLPSCVDWCKAAKDCVGQQYYSDYMRHKSVVVKERLIRELEHYFGKDLKRINHAKKVMDFAEAILMKEGGDWQIVVSASILHDIGIKVAEEKYGSCAGHYQEKEGPEIARKVMLKVGFKKSDIDEICEIIAHHHSPGVIKTSNFKVLYDADWLVNLNDETKLRDKLKLKHIIEKVFLTKTGRQLAEAKYL